MKFLIQNIHTQVQHPEPIPPTYMIWDYQYRMIMYIYIPTDFNFVEVVPNIKFIVNFEEIIDEEIVSGSNHNVKLYPYNLSNKSTKNTNCVMKITNASLFLVLICVYWTKLWNINDKTNQPT